MNENKKLDRRVKRTKLALRTELLKLLMKKRLNAITVKELCEAADLNRGTFYLHYMDVFDLFEQIQKEMHDEIIAFIAKNAKSGKLGDPKNMLPTFLELFDYLVLNQDVCMVLLMQSSSQDYIQSLLNIGFDNCVENWIRMYGIKERRVAEMFYHYIVNGCVGILRYWLQTGRKESSSELAQLTKQCITQGIAMLENCGK